MYSARITREHRAAFVLLTDRSGSMTEEVVFEGGTMSKAEAVARIINRFLDELVNRCRREEGVRDYFDIAVLEYSGDGIVSLLPGVAGFTTPAELVRMPVETVTEYILRRLPNGNQISATVDRRQWVRSKAVGNTPMGAALAEAENAVRSWCSKPANAASFPPVVINITDGEASDACFHDLCDCAERIRSTGTTDGNTLLFNMHLARRDDDTSAAGISFPCRPEELPPHPYARLLWDMSSEMPACYEHAIAEGRAGAVPPFRAMSYNCAVDELFSMLTIGSVSGTVII